MSESESESANIFDTSQVTHDFIIDLATFYAKKLIFIRKILDEGCDKVAFEKGNYNQGLCHITRERIKIHNYAMLAKKKNDDEMLFLSFQYQLVDLVLNELEKTIKHVQQVIRHNI